MSARPPIEPRVFLSLSVSVTPSAAFFTFLAMLFLLRIDDQDILPEILLGFFDLLTPVIKARVRDCGPAFGKIHKLPVEFLRGTIIIFLDRRDGPCHLSQVPQEDLTPLALLLHALALVQI